jgi:hypothetical protein
MRVDALDHLAVQLQHKAQNAVRRRMLRAEIDVEVADVVFRSYDNAFPVAAGSE